MRVVENYRPERIEFNVVAMDVPNDLGEFDSAEEAQKFVNKHMIAVPEQIETYRKMDAYEKSVIRERYKSELEDALPEYQDDLLTATIDLENAKEIEKRAKENVKACMNKVESLAKEAKNGVAEINLDQAFTWKVALNGSYYFYTYMDKMLQLADIRTIPSHEANTLFNASQQNELFFNTLKAASGE